jgi:carboxyl-terminal processing protease
MGNRAVTETDIGIQNFTKESLMRIFCNQRTVLLLTLILLAVLFSTGIEKGTTQNVQTLPLPLTPTVRERVVALHFANLLERYHLSQRPLDQSVSKEAFRLYIKMIDSRKLYFYQSDIDEFRAKYELKLCDAIKQQDVMPAFEIYNRFLERFKERMATAQKILAEPIDFTVDEEIVSDKTKDFTFDENVIKAKGLQTFPKTPEEANDRWRKQIKYELLGMKAVLVADIQKRDKAVADGKTPPEIDDRDPVERMKTRYISFQRRTLFEGRIDNAEILANVRKQANEDVMEIFLSAVAGALDYHSSYMNPATAETFGKIVMGKTLEGIGATLSTEDGYTVVRDVVRGGPADKSGEIRAKDKIQGVGQGKDGKIEPVLDFKITDVIKQIRGDKGTVVRLDVLPGGKGPSKIVEIVRDEIKLDDQAAQSEIFDAGKKADGTPYKIGYIELPDFYFDMDAAMRGERDVRSATSDLQKMLGEFVKADVDAVVLDLRSNGGGSLQMAIDITGLFMGSCVVVQTKDETRKPEPRTSAPSCDWTGPFVVVTNKYSASASEILSGAIKDHKRGLIVGDSVSHGKGTVQSLYKLSERIFAGLGNTDSYGSGKVTIQGFYRPSGITTQGIGVEADILLPSRSEVREGILESDLDNALVLRPIVPVNYTPKGYVTPQMVTELRRRSAERIKESEDFKKELERIALYKEVREKRTMPLNEAKYMAEIERFNSDEWDREELEELLNTDKKIVRDFYIDEVLAITVDYVKATQEFGIAFPKERSIQVRRGGFFGGFGL